MNFLFIKKFCLASSTLFFLVYILLYLKTKNKFDDNNNKRKTLNTVVKMITKEISTNLVVRNTTGRKKLNIVVSTRKKLNTVISKAAVNKLITPGAPLPVIESMDWEQLNSNVFFKRTGAFYIIEKQLLRIFFISKVGHGDYKYDVKLNVEHRKNLIFSSFIFRNVSVKNHAKRGYYSSDSLDLNINLTHYADKKDYDLLTNETFYKFYVSIISNNKKESTKNPLKLNLRYIRQRKNKKKSRSIICSKCLFYEPSQYPELLWWVELTKLAGYEKIVFCNMSIPNTRHFDKIFEKHKDFIELVQFKTIPNFSSSSPPQKYLTHYFQIKQKNGKYHTFGRDMFDLLIETECFYNNAAQYEFISVHDTDETIIPRVNSKLMKSSNTFNYVKSLNSINEKNLNLDSSCEKNTDRRFEPYIARLGKNKNFHFKMGFYLSDVIVKEVFSAFEVYFNSKKFNSNLNQHRITSVSKRKINNYTFLIAGKDELKYAKNLLSIYKYYLKSFYAKDANKTYFSKIFGSLFFLFGRSTSNYMGKTVYDTDIGFGLGVHYPKDSSARRVSNESLVPF